MQGQFRERATGKTYLALVQGAWPAGNKVIDLPLHKYLLPDGERRVRVTTPEDPDGMPRGVLGERDARARGQGFGAVKSGRIHGRYYKSNRSSTLRKET